MSARNVLPSLAMTAVLLAAAVAGLGIPDFGLARDFLFGTFQSTDGALAAAGILCWAAVLAIALITLGGSFRHATEIQLIHRRWTRAILFVAGGAALIVMGAFHHSTGGYAMCCGNESQHVLEAQQLVSAH